MNFMYAVFDESLFTGNKVIDEQHKELIAKINKLVECCENSTGQVESIKILDYLSEYTEFHFGEEESLQAAVNYPGIEEHKQKHEELRATVKVLHEMLEEEEGPSKAFVDAVQNNVINWLYGHIKGYDCSVATYINLHDIPELV